MGHQIGKLADRDKLTQRELDVMARIALGYQNKEIAAELCISQRTVQCHATHIFDKLRVSNRTEATAYYFGWIRQERISQ